MKRRILALMTAMTMALSLGACGLFGTEKEQGTSEDENTLTVNVTRLRKKLEEIGLCEFIKTRKGIGYQIREEQVR